MIFPLPDHPARCAGSRPTGTVDCVHVCRGLSDNRWTRGWGSRPVGARAVPLPLVCLREASAAPALGRFLDELGQPLLPGLFLLRAHDPPDGRAAVPGRLGLEELPRRLVGPELLLLG